MSAQPPMIGGFQFDENPVAQGIQRLIALLDQLDQRAQRVTSRLQNAGGPGGGTVSGGVTADQRAVEGLTRSIESLGTNFTRVTDAALAGFTAVQTRIEETVAAMINLGDEGRRTGEQLGQAARRAAGAPGDSQNVPAGQLAALAGRQADLETARIRNLAAQNQERENRGLAEGGTIEQDAARRQLAETNLAKAERDLEAAITKRARAEQLLIQADATGNIERQARATQLLTGRLDQETVARDKAGQAAVNAGKVAESIDSRQAAVDDKASARFEVLKQKRLETIQKNAVAEQAASERTEQRQEATDDRASARFEVLKDKRIKAVTELSAAEQAAAQRQANREATFVSRQPIREQSATTGRENAVRQLTQAENALLNAERQVTEAQRRGSTPEQQAAAQRSLATAVAARTAATRSLIDAEQRLRVVSNPNSTREQVAAADLLARTSRQGAVAALTHANSQAKLADSIKSVGKPASETHDKLLALLGVSRFLPGALGQAVSGFALLEGATRSSAGFIIGVTGAIATVIIQLGRLGGQFNEALNKTRAQAEGLGLTITEVRAFQAVLDQTGGTIENFAVGIKKINEAVTGIGADAKDTKNLLTLVFAGTGFDFTKVTSSLEKGSATKQIILELAKQVETLEKAGLASAVAAQIFGRSWDEVKGRLRDIAQQEQDFEKAIRDSGVTAKEAEENARSYARAIAELNIAWQSFAAQLSGPVTAVVKGLQILLEDQEKTINRIKSTIKSGEIARARELADEINRLQAGGNVSSGSIFSQGFARKAVEGIRDVGPGTSAADRQKQIDIRTKELESLGFSFEQLNKQLTLEKENAAKQKQSEEDSATIQKEMNDAREKKLEALAKGASLSDQAAAARGAIIAGKQNELQLIQKERQSAEKAFDLDQLFLTGKLSEAARAAAAEKRIKDLQQLTGLRELERRLRTEISELEKEDKGDTPVKRLQLQAEELTEQIRAADRASEKFRTLAEKLIKVREQIVKLATTPGERRSFLKDLSRDRSFIQGETFEAGQQKFQETIRTIETKSTEAIDRIQRARQDRALETERALQAGQITTLEAARQEAQGVLDVLDTAQRAFNEKKAVIDARIKEIQASGLDPDKAKAAILKLQAESSKAGSDFLKQRLDASGKIIRIEDDEKEHLIQNRQDLLATEIALQEASNKRRLDLIERAARDSADIQEKAIQEAADNDIQITELELARLATLFNDRRKLIVAIVSESILAGNVATRTATNALAQGLADPSKGGLLGVIKAGSPEEIRILGEALTEAANQGAAGAKELLEIYKAILLLRQKQADIEQQRIIKTEDLSIEKAKRLLEINKDRITLATDLLSIEEARLQFLTQEGLISKSESTERQIEIERRRLALLREQATQIERQAKVAAAGIGVRNAASPIKGGVVEAINASPEISQLNQELRRVQAETIATADRLELMDSVLGRVRTGLDSLIGALDRAPEQFDEFSTAIVQRSLKGFADAARGVQKLIEVILGARLQKKSPAEELAESTAKFNAGVQSAAIDFKAVIKQAADEFRLTVTGGTRPRRAGGFNTGNAADDELDIQSALPGFGAAAGGGGFSKVIGKVVSKAFTVATGVIDGLSAETIGGKIAGFGQIAAAFGPVGQAVAAAAQIVGGIADFIGAGFRKRAENIAKDVQANLDLINQKFKEGALTLGETTQALQKQLESARAQLGSGKIGKKGGKAELAKIEKDVQAQLQQLRDQAKQIQDDFLKGLELQRIAPELRSIKQAVDDAEKRALDFLRSFETGAEALQHFGEAQEFLNRTLQDLKQTATDQLDEIIKREIDAEAAFQKQRQDLINQGRVTTFIDAAADRLTALFDLEKRRAEERASAESEEAKLRNQISLIDASFSKASDLIDKMRSSFENLAAGLSQIFGGGGGGVSTGVRGTALEALRTGGVGSSAFSGNLNISVSLTAGSPNEAALRTKDAVESTLAKLGLVSRVSISRARPVGT